MSLREDIEKIEREVEETSFAFELLKDQRKQNKRQFIIILFLIIGWFITGAYLVYVLNDIGSVTETDEIIDIQDVEQINDSTIKIGDEIWEKSQ